MQYSKYYLKSCKYKNYNLLTIESVLKYVDFFNSYYLLESTMKSVNKFNTYQPRPCRYFSDDFKKKIVKEIDTKRITIKDAASLYEVSNTAIYTWLYKYSKTYEKGTNMVLELESEAEKTKFLMNKVAELERAIGQKTMENDFLQKVIDLSSEELGYDLKKKYSTTLSNGLR